MSKEIMNTKEAAAYLSLSPHTLNVRRCQGVEPRYIKLGEKMVRYRKQDLDAWVEASIKGESA